MEPSYVLYTFRSVDGVEECHAFVTDHLGVPLTQAAAQAAGEALVLAAEHESDGTPGVANPSPLAFMVLPAEEVPTEVSSVDTPASEVNVEQSEPFDADTALASERQQAGDPFGEKAAEVQSAGGGDAFQELPDPGPVQSETATTPVPDPEVTDGDGEE